MTIKIAGCLGGALLAAVLGCGGAALAQNNPGGPDDRSGTVTHMPGPTGAPGTFDAKTDTTSSSAASGNAAAGSPAAPDSTKPRTGTAPAGNGER